MENLRRQVLVLCLCHIYSRGIAFCAKCSPMSACVCVLVCLCATDYQLLEDNIGRRLLHSPPSSMSCQEQAGDHRDIQNRTRWTFNVIQQGCSLVVKKTSDLMAVEERNATSLGTANTDAVRNSHWMHISHIAQREKVKFAAG